MGRRLDARRRGGDDPGCARRSRAAATCADRHRAAASAALRGGGRSPPPARKALRASEQQCARDRGRRSRARRLDGRNDGLLRGRRHRFCRRQPASAGRAKPDRADRRGRPTLIGPHMYNFADAAEKTLEPAPRSKSRCPALVATFAELIATRRAAKQWHAALAFHAAHHGAADGSRHGSLHASTPPSPRPGTRAPICQT